MRIFLLILLASGALAGCVGEFTTANIESTYQRCMANGTLHGSREALETLCRDNRAWSYNRRFSMARMFSSSGGVEPDPAYDEANRAMDYNDKQARRIMDAYVAVQLDRVKAGEISRVRANALIRLKVAEVAADMAKSNREVVDNFNRSKSIGRSLTCMTTTSYNSAFTTCN